MIGRKSLCTKSVVIDEQTEKLWVLLSLCSYQNSARVLDIGIQTISNFTRFFFDILFLVSTSFSARYRLKVSYVSADLSRLSLNIYNKYLESNEIFNIFRKHFLPVMGGGSTMVDGPKNDGISFDVVTGVFRSPVCVSPHCASDGNDCCDCFTTPLAISTPLGVAPMPPKLAAA